MKTKYWFSICYFLTLSLSSWAAIEPGNSKAFKIQFHGRTSFILGTWHDFDVQAFKIPSEILAGLNQVDEVILETDRFDHRGELLAEPEPDISIEKIVAFKPIKLGARPNAVARSIFENSDLKDFYSRLSPGLIHFFAHSFADQIISDNIIKAAEAFATGNYKLKGRLGRIRLKPSHRNATDNILGPISDDELFTRAFEYFMSKRSFSVPRSGIDSEVYREARKRGLKISGLQNTEPYKDGIEANLAFVNESDVNKTLLWLGEMISEKNAAQNWSNIVHSNYLIKSLQRRFFEIGNRSFIELTDLVAAFPSPAPGEERLKEYEQSRHQYWVPALVRRMKKSPVFIAVGLGHVIGTSKQKNLLDYLREQGAIIEPIIACESLLGTETK